MFLKDYPLARTRMEEIAVRRLQGDDGNTDKNNSSKGERQKQAVKPFNAAGKKFYIYHKNIRCVLFTHLFDWSFKNHLLRPWENNV